MDKLLSFNQIFFLLILGSRYGFAVLRGLYNSCWSQAFGEKIAAKLFQL
jgi:hypothetical protein